MQTRTEQAEARLQQAETRTERAQAHNEEALRASELRYRRLFEAAKDGILILDADTGRISDVNPLLIELLDFSHSELVGKTVAELSPFKDMESNQAMLDRLHERGYVRYEDLPLQTKSGRPIAVEFVSNVYQAGDKKVIQCNVRDVTARKKSEQQLTLLNTCVSNLNDIVLVTEAALIDEWGPRVVFVNEAFERITGYTSAETLGRSLRFLEGKRTDLRILEEIRQALADQRPIQRQIINCRKDGSEYWLDIDIVPIFDPAGKCTHFTAVGRDITETKKTETRFRRLVDCGAQVHLPAMEGCSEGLEDPVELLALPRGNGETILVVDDEVAIRTGSVRLTAWSAPCAPAMGFDGWLFPGEPRRRR